MASVFCREYREGAKLVASGRGIFALRHPETAVAAALPVRAPLQYLAKGRGSLKLLLRAPHRA